MIESPEALILAGQLTKTIAGKEITDVIVNYSLHKFAWFYQNPDDYAALLVGKKIDFARANGGQVEIFAGKARLVFTDGVNLRYILPEGELPDKHQLLIGFDDDSCIVATVQMYGGLWCFEEGKLDSPYYLAALEKPGALSETFTESYFMEMINREDMQKKSLKAMLATEQSIPGLGNGVLQDILFNASLHPRRKIFSLADTDKVRLFRSIKDTLSEMYVQGGRDTEKNLFGEKGGYITQLSKNTLGSSCSRCGKTILKEGYFGGTVYYCPGCQKE